MFASALREALRDDRCDVVVHSLKDLPTAEEPGLAIGAVPKRVDARDALCARDELTLDTLPQGARVGTGSPRRVAQLLARRPDLQVIDIRGNVDTRLRKVVDGELDAVVLAAAGLESPRPTGCRHGIPRARRVADRSRSGGARARGSHR